MERCSDWVLGLDRAGKEEATGISVDSGSGPVIPLEKRRAATRTLPGDLSDKTGVKIPEPFTVNAQRPRQIQCFDELRS